jgi:ribosome-binding protein aMBF1 (putative translation factor)
MTNPTAECKPATAELAPTLQPQIADWSIPLAKPPKKPAGPAPGQPGKRLSRKRKRRVSDPVAQRLAALRTALGVSLNDLAARINVPVEELTAYEAGTLPIPPDVLARISKTLSADIDRYFAPGGNDK